MAYEHKPNTGSIFKNDKKEKDTHADYKGSALIDGVDYWISCWINETKDGQKYLKFSFDAKDEKVEKPAAVEDEPEVEEEDDGEVMPF